MSKKIKGIRVLHGIEVNIDADGKPDMPDKVLKGFDVVVGSIHSGFKNSREIITKRMDNILFVFIKKYMFLMLFYIYKQITYYYIIIVFYF